MPHESTIERIRAEYLEMPGLSLTVAQAERLWHVDAGICKLALDALVDAKFLCIKDGCYARRGDLVMPRPRAAIAYSQDRPAGAA